LPFSTKSLQAIDLNMAVKRGEEGFPMLKKLWIIFMSISAIILLGAFSSVEAVKLPNEIQLDGDIFKKPDTSRIRLVEGYGKLPLHFEANHGQTDPRVNFLSRGRGFTLLLTPEEALLSLRRGNPNLFLPSTFRTSLKASVLRMKWLGGNHNPRIVGIEKLEGKSNYFIGNDPGKWRTRIPHYAKIRYRKIYPGIDLIYYGNHRQLEYDFVVAAGADPNAIRFIVEGVEGVKLDGDGNLIFRLSGGEIILQAPLIYQKIEGEKRFIDGSYVIHSHEEGKTNGKHTIGFRIGKYEATKPLVIDPVLIYSTYLGGTDDDYGRGIAVDSSGNAYVTGDTGSNDFPTQGEYQGWVGGGPDVFVTKLNSDGDSLVYSTYLGD